VYGIRRRKRHSEYTERKSWLPAGVDVLGAVVGAELRCRWRERSSVASAVVLPVALAALVTAVLGREAPDVRFTFAVVDRADDAASAAFIDEALGHPTVAEVVDTRRVATERAADRLLDADDVDAVVILPDDLGARLADGIGDTGITVEAAEPLAGDLGAMVVDRYVTRARTTAVALARTGHAPTGDWPLRVELAAPGGQRLDAAHHYGPGIGMFFVLVGVGFAAQRLVADRRRGLVDRMATTPASPLAIAFGRALAALAIGALSLGSCALAMQVLFERPWGPPLPLAVLVAATVLALAGVAAVVAVISRTPEQASLAGSAVAFAFALASGTFSPPGSFGTRPPLAELVPTTHALDGFALLATEPPGAGLAGLAPILAPIGALGAFALAGGLATALLTRRAR
jgi:ABC-2 type transport system permease protein